MAAVLPLSVNDSIAGQISAAGEVDEFQVNVPDCGRMTLTVQTAPGTSLDTRLSLLAPDHRLLIQSDGQSVGNHDDVIAQHVLGGTYFIQVEGLGSGTGAYTLTTKFQAANPPNLPLLADYPHDFPFAITPWFSATADFNGDRIPDIATANTFTNDVTVLLGLGDGTFHSAGNFGVGNNPYGIVSGDFNEDSIVDLAVANQNAEPEAPARPGAPANGYDVSILLGNADGTFKPETRVLAGNRAWGMATADLDGDGHLDLMIANLASSDLSVSMGNGDATFQPEVRYPAGDFPNYVLAGDFNHDGHPDLVSESFFGDTLSILLNKGDGTFANKVDLPAGGKTPTGVLAEDFNADGDLDIAVANAGSGVIAIHLGNGDGSFQNPVSYAVGSSPYVAVAGDFNHDGRLDLAVNNRQSNDVSVLLGRGDGTFGDEVRYRAGLQPVYTMVADFNGDDILDLATANGRSHDVSVLLGLGDGTFQPDLTDPRRGETNPLGMVAADFNGDVIPDLATVSYTGHEAFVFLGRGDGTFQQRMSFEIGSTPVSLIARDINADGTLDLITANCDSADISVLLGNGDGTFQDQMRFPASNSGEFMLAGDFNGDSHLDLINSGEFSTGIALILGNGDGTFQPPRKFGLGDAPADGVLGDFNGDRKLDLAVTNFFSPRHDVAVFLGNGDGTFQDEKHYAAGNLPFGIVAGDFDRDGALDLAVSNTGRNDVSLLSGRGDGTFRPEIRYPVGVKPDSLVAADFNGDGGLDLAVSNAGAPEISVLLRRSDGTFQQATFPAGDRSTPRAGLVVADFNRDGRLDLATSQIVLNNVAVLLGRGDGNFQAPLPFPVGLGPSAVTAGDVNNDGRLDVASVNPTTDKLAVSLGVGDATIQSPVYLDVGAAPAAVVHGDFNRDGRRDLATANFGSRDVSVFLGLGDGSFRRQQRFAVGTNPVAVVAGDFNGDGILDLATADAGSNDVSILFSRGDGTFQPQVRLPAGDLPQALLTGDFNGDGHADLAIANYRSQDLWLYAGRGNGRFAAPLRYALQTSPVSLAAGDFNRDGLLDLVTANYLSNDVSVLLGQRGGAFAPPVRFEAGSNPVSVIVSDLDGDGRNDLVTANSASLDVGFLLGRGDGTFAAPVRRPLGDYAVAVAAADFTDDGLADLAIITQLSTDVSILQGLGDLRFVPGGTISNPIHATPLVGDWNGDGVADVAVVNLKGEILLRPGRPGTTGIFEAPVIINPAPAPRARDLAVVSTGNAFLLAALDAQSQSLSFYARGPDGSFTRRAGPHVPGTLPVAIAAADLNGDGRDDLVLADAGSNEVLVYLQNAAGGFGPAPDFDVGVGISPSAIELALVDGDQRPDIVVTNQFSGDVSVLTNDAKAPFACESRFRAGTGLYWLENHDGHLLVRSRQGTAALVAGDFAADSGSDLIVVNSAANSFSVLRGNGDGGFLNPARALTYTTGLHPTVVVAGRFNDDPYLDLAVLNEGSADLSIFLGDGHGGFVAPVGRDPRALRLSAGYLPTGLAVHDVNGDGRPDLLVGNSFGDLLTLLGNGDGTFLPYQRADRNIALAVADLNGDGRDDFIFGNESLDRVAVQYSQPGAHFEQDRDDGLLGPGAVQVADLNADANPDLVVANTGANNVLVYLGVGNGQFGTSRSFFAGTNPAGITIQDLNADGVADLVVANQGSNDVTVLLGQGRGGKWTLTPGPRLGAGSAPVSTTVADVTGDGISDLLVTNSQSNNVELLPGVGGGFFNDQKPVVFDTGPSPRQALVGDFDGRAGLDLISLNAGSSSLTFFSGFAAGGSVGVSFPSGGANPVAALVGDFNRDGLADLVVAHQGNGVIALLLGHEDGPRLSGLQSASVAHPTGLAFADAAPNQLAVYIAGEGAEAVQRLSFVFDLGPISLPASVGLLSDASSRVQVADVLPLQDATVAVVATLLTVRLDRETLARQLASDRLPDQIDVGEQQEAPAEVAAASTLSPEQIALFGFLTGQEEALRSRSELTRDDLLNPGRGVFADEDRPTPRRQSLDEWLSELSDHLDDTTRALLETARWTATRIADGVALPWGRGGPPPAAREPHLLPPRMEQENPQPQDPEEISIQDNVPADKTLPMASLVAALFALGVFQADKTVRSANVQERKPRLHKRTIPKR